MGWIFARLRGQPELASPRRLGSQLRGGGEADQLLQGLRKLLQEFRQPSSSTQPPAPSSKPDASKRTQRTQASAARRKEGTPSLIDALAKIVDRAGKNQPSGGNDLIHKLRILVGKAEAGHLDTAGPQPATRSSSARSSSGTPSATQAAPSGGAKQKEEEPTKRKKKTQPEKKEEAPPAAASWADRAKKSNDVSAFSFVKLRAGDFDGTLTEEKDMTDAVSTAVTGTHIIVGVLCELPNCWEALSPPEGVTITAVLYKEAEGSVTVRCPTTDRAGTTRISTLSLVQKGSPRSVMKWQTTKVNSPLAAAAPINVLPAVIQLPLPPETTE